MTKDEILAYLDERGLENVMLADGFESAFLGFGISFNTALAVYDVEICTQLLMDRDGMTREEAEEFFDYKVISAYVGENTPVFLYSKKPTSTVG